MSDEKRKVKSSLRKGGENAGDPWPDEPAELDPDSLGPGSGLAGGSDLGEGDYDVDGETFRAFWGAVVMANVALFGLTVGPMFIFFRGDYAVGGLLFLVGLGSLARTYSTYRDYQSDGEDSSEDAAGDSTEDAGDADGDR